MITAIIAISGFCSISTMFGLVVNAVREQNELEQDNMIIDQYYNRQN